MTFSVIPANSTVYTTNAEVKVNIGNQQQIKLDTLNFTFNKLGSSISSIPLQILGSGDYFHIYSRGSHEVFSYSISQLSKIQQYTLPPTVNFSSDDNSTGIAWNPYLLTNATLRFHASVYSDTNTSTYVIDPAGKLVAKIMANTTLSEPNEIGALRFDQFSSTVFTSFHLNGEYEIVATNLQSLSVQTFTVDSVSNLDYYRLYHSELYAVQSTSSGNNNLVKATSGSWEVCSAMNNPEVDDTEYLNAVIFQDQIIDIETGSSGDIPFILMNVFDLETGRLLDYLKFNVDNQRLDYSRVSGSNIEEYVDLYNQVDTYTLRLSDEGVLFGNNHLIIRYDNNLWYQTDFSDQQDIRTIASYPMTDRIRVFFLANSADILNPRTSDTKDSPILTILPTFFVFIMLIPIRRKQI